MPCEPKSFGPSAFPTLLRAVGTLLQRLGRLGGERRAAPSERFHPGDDGFLALDDVACIRTYRG